MAHHCPICGDVCDCDGRDTMLDTNVVDLTCACAHCCPDADSLAAEIVAGEEIIDDEEEDDHAEASARARRILGAEY